MKKIILFSFLVWKFFGSGVAEATTFNYNGDARFSVYYPGKSERISSWHQIYHSDNNMQIAFDDVTNILTADIVFNRFDPPNPDTGNYGTPPPLINNRLELHLTSTGYGQVDQENNLFFDRSYPTDGALQFFDLETGALEYEAILPSGQNVYGVVLVGASNTGLNGIFELSHDTSFGQVHIEGGLSGQLRFTGTDNGQQEVPEPGTMLLLGSGLLALAKKFKGKSI